MSSFSRFFLITLGVTLIILAGSWIVFTTVLEGIPFRIDYIILCGFFLGLTLLVHFMLTRAAAKDPKKFVPAFMGIIGFKMMICLIFLLIYIVLNKANALPFGILFLVCYLTFTAIEVTALLRHLRQMK